MGKRANDVRSMEPIHHGAYVCFKASPRTVPVAASAAVQALADRLGLRNEFFSEGGDPKASYAYLRRVIAAPGEIPDDGLEQADVVVHVAAPSPGPVAEFCSELERVLGPQVKARVLRGAVRPPTYTGNAMHNFSYAHRVVQQPGTVMPNSFLIPVSKTPAWWEKDWMERHTYFLPRYDHEGQMLHEGHTLAAAAGITCLLRRTYKPEEESTPAGQYDFVSYFECADEDVPTFQSVCAALRDTDRNPEWKFVREGPTWQGRRVATWDELFG